MLNDAQPWVNLLTRFVNSKVQGDWLTDEVWEKCFKLVKLLRYFYEATNFFSGVYYPTVHQAMLYFVNIVYVFHQYKDDEFLKPTVEAMQKK